jgi:CubicO group peptidase (beta-lactamase class C family)
VDDFLAFTRLLLNRGVHGGIRLLAEHLVELMTTNHLTPEQIAGGSLVLDGNGWGMGVSAILKSGRYCWAGGHGTDFPVDPAQRLIAIAMTQ